MKRGILAVSVMAMMVGCATGPYSPVEPSSLKGTHVIYFEQSDRVPKTVMMAPWESYANGKTGVVMSANMALDPAIIAGIIEKLLKTAPEIVKSYSNERMANAMIGRRILFRGYEGTNDLIEIEKIIKAMGGVVENWTPQVDPK